VRCSARTAFALNSQRAATVSSSLTHLVRPVQLKTVWRRRTWTGRHNVLWGSVRHPAHSAFDNLLENKRLGETQIHVMPIGSVLYHGSDRYKICYTAPTTHSSTHDFTFVSSVCSLFVCSGPLCSRTPSARMWHRSTAFKLFCYGASARIFADSSR